MTDLNMRNMRDHYPGRDDQVLAWLKDRRRRYGDAQDPDGAARDALDELIEEYERAADEEISLEEVVNASIYLEERVDERLARKKAEREGRSR